MASRRTIYKWFWVWNFEKEEEWLNEMAMNGWVLESVGFCTYHFIRCEPGEYSVRLEMHPYDESYVSFMEETGAEYVGRMMMWIYFRKKTADGPFDLFSDIDSRIRSQSGDRPLQFFQSFPPGLGQPALRHPADVRPGPDPREEGIPGKRTPAA